MNAWRSVGIAVALMALSGCSKDVTAPEPPLPPPDLRAVDGYLYWEPVPIGLAGLRGGRAAPQIALANQAGARPGTPGAIVLGSDENNTVVVGTGCLPAVSMTCTGTFPDCRIDYYVDGVLWWDRASPMSEPRGRWLSAFGQTWVPPDTGTHMVRVVLDPDHRYAETDETNNEVSFRVHVIPGDLAAGMIEFVDWGTGSPQRVTTIRAGRPLSVVSWTFAHGVYTDHHSVFEVNGTPLFDRHMTLRGGTFFPDIKIDTVQYVPPAPGTYAFVRRVDPGGVIDANAADNESEATLTVTP